jgi:hypothetical protein
MVTGHNRIEAEISQRLPHIRDEAIQSGPVSHHHKNIVIVAILPNKHAHRVGPAVQRVWDQVVRQAWNFGQYASFNDLSTDPSRLDGALEARDFKKQLSAKHSPKTYQLPPVQLPAVFTAGQPNDIFC